jgi:hypothetical protein
VEGPLPSWTKVSVGTRISVTGPQKFHKETACSVKKKRKKRKKRKKKKKKKKKEKKKKKMFYINCNIK